MARTTDHNFLADCCLPLQLTCCCRDLQPKYMTPLEVEEIMRRLWQHEAHLLNLVYSAEMAAVTLKQGAQAGLSKAAVGSSRAPDYEGYRMFFVRTLLVAPNKFRPPSRVGEQL